MIERHIQEKSTYSIHTLSDTDWVASEILQRYPEARIFLLEGDLGAGKTTLVQAFCRYLSTREQAKSPTFSIINEYLSPGGPVYHFDFYRLEDEEEATGLGLEEFWDSGSYCFIEWPERILSWLPQNALHLNLSLETEGNRIIQITPLPVQK